MVVDKMVELIGGVGYVVVVGYSQILVMGIDWCDGFVNQMKEKYFDVQIVIIEYGDGDYLKLIEIIKVILVVNFDIKGIFGINEGVVIGVLNGVCEMNLKVVVIGFDSGKVQKDVICLGVMVGVIMQNLVGIGYEIVKVVVVVVKGEIVFKDIDIGFFWYDKLNIDVFEIVVVFYD